MSCEICGDDGHNILSCPKLQIHLEAELLNNTGHESAQRGEFETALNYYEEALNRNPKFALAWVNKGIALKNLYRFDEAVAVYQHVIDEVDPRFKKAWYNHANTLFAMMQAITNGPAFSFSFPVGIDTSDERFSWLGRNAVQLLDKALDIDPDYQIARDLRDGLAKYAGS